MAKNLDDGHKVIITQDNPIAGEYRLMGDISRLEVKAPLPETVSIGVSNEINAPFGGYGSSGKVVQVLALANISNRVGLTTRKQFMGVEHPEITFEVEFEAYDDAFTDVIVPAYTLLLMASAATQSPVNDDIAQSVADFINTANRYVTDNVEIARTFLGKEEVSGSQISQLIRFVKGAPPCDVQFGRFLVLNDMFITNATANFSNTLDYRYLPMKATVSLTFTPQEPMFTQNLHKSFEISKGGR